MASPTLLKFGDSGYVVAELIRVLILRGFLEDGHRTHDFDRLVRQAVKDFQARHVDPRGVPLSIDGAVGPLTWWALTHPDNTDILLPLRPTPTIPSGENSRGRAALEIALLEMAAGAREVGANNCGPWVEKYLSGRVPAPANWCTAFICWCFAQQAAMPFRFTLGAQGLRNTFRRKGWLIDPTDEHPLQPGDLVFWWRDQPSGWKGHVGFVHHVADGILYSVEGNKGGFPAPVRGFDYVLADMERLLGFGRVPEPTLPVVNHGDADA